MSYSIQTIALTDLALAFIPALVVLVILYRWSLDYKDSVIAIARMLVQLLLIGYFLAFIFESDNTYLIIGILSMMIMISSWIALRTIKEKRKQLYFNAFIAIATGGGLTLLLITQGVLDLQPWHSPRYLIPLAGMIFANSLNSVSLAADRFYAETEREVDYTEARNIAFRASLIPITNSLLAVGIVSLPGMMTGQILSGTSPLIAVRYQIMVMCMIFGSAGISAAIFLALIRTKKNACIN